MIDLLLFSPLISVMAAFIIRESNRQEPPDARPDELLKTTLILAPLSIIAAVLYVYSALWIYEELSDPTQIFSHPTRQFLVLGLIGLVLTAITLLTVFIGRLIMKRFLLNKKNRVRTAILMLICFAVAGYAFLFFASYYLI